MRADRLVATLLLLLARGRVTAAEVAEQLEVSERTARRDLEALGVAGIPVYSQQGRGGGWSLLGGARTDLSGLTAAQARALFLVAGPSAAATPELGAALRKLVRALPETFRAQAEAAAAAVVIDPTGWGRAATGSPPPPAHLPALQQAVVEGVQVRLGYAGPRRAAGERVVHPLGLVEKHSVWYLVAGTDDGLRTFRVTRVTSVSVTSDPVERPEGFDLEQTWRSVTTAFDDRRAPCSVAVRADASIVGVLKGVFGARLAIGPTQPADGDGRVAVEVRGSSVPVLAAELAGFGHRIEVVGPPAARQHLARLGEELTAMYSTAGRRRVSMGP